MLELPLDPPLELLLEPDDPVMPLEAAPVSAAIPDDELVPASPPPELDVLPKLVVVSVVDPVESTPDVSLPAPVEVALLDTAPEVDGVPESAVVLLVPEPLSVSTETPAKSTHPAPEPSEVASRKQLRSGR